MIDEDILDWAVREGLALAGISQDDQEMFNRVRARVLNLKINPPMKIIIPSFELLKDGEKRPEMSPESKAALFAACFYDDVYNVATPF